MGPENYLQVACEKKIKPLQRLYLAEWSPQKWPFYAFEILHHLGVTTITIVTVRH